jgi:hypothetical protein
MVCGIGLLLAGIVVSSATASLTAEQEQTARKMILEGQGLIGVYYNDDEFDEREIGMIDLLTTIDCEWRKSRGSDWSARWSGFIQGPTTGEVTFTADASDGVRLQISDTYHPSVGNMVVIDGLAETGPRSGKISMTEGWKHPIVLEFTSRSGNARLRLHWQWAGKEKEIVPAAALSHSTEGLPKDFMVFDFDNRPSEQDGGDDDDDDEPEFLDFLPRFTGGQPPYADTDYHDGRFRPVVGAHNFEVMRCNRTYPQPVTDDIPSYPDAGIENVGFTYNHAPMLCYWKGKFWVLYRSGPVHEHQEPCYALITWSEDGRNWHKPQTVFAAQKFRNRSEDDKVQYSISHQRMGWYVSPEGKLIACAYYGMPDTPNNGKGIGRVVREVKGPGKYGPIYWVRYNEFQGYSKDNSPHYPYTKGLLRPLTDCWQTN